jgi:hypothetical protein
MPSNEFSGDRKLIYRYWISGDKNIHYNIKKNRLSLQALCNIKQIPCVSLESDSSEFDYDKARDLAHYGILSHEHIASKFLDKYLHGKTN